MYRLDNKYQFCVSKPPGDPKVLDAGYRAWSYYFLYIKTILIPSNAAGLLAESCFYRLKIELFLESHCFQSFQSAANLREMDHKEKRN